MADCNVKNLTKVIRGNAVTLTFNDGIQGFKGLVQSFELSYAREVTQINDLVSNDIVYVQKPGQGELKIVQVVGCKLPAMDCSCEPGELIINVSGASCYENGDCSSLSGFINLKKVMQSSIALSGSVENWVLVGQISYKFAELEISS